MNKIVPQEYLTGAPIEQSGAGQNNAFSITSIVNIVLRRLVLIAVTAAVCVAFACVYIALSPARYTATATMIIDTKRPQLVSTNDVLSEGQVDQAAVESQIETIKSEAVGARVVKSLELDKDHEFAGGGRGLLQSLFEMFGLEDSTMSQDNLRRQAIGTFSRGLKVNRVARSYVVDVAFTSLDPAKAAKIANETSEAYISDQLESKFEATQRASVWLQQRISQLREQASDAYKTVQDYKQENNIIIDASTGKLSTEREVDELTSSLARARADTSQAEARFARINSVMSAEATTQAGLPDPAVTDALSNQVITRLRQQYLDSQKQENDYSIRYGKNHQSAVNLRVEMAGLQKAIWDEVRRIGETYKSELQIARSREQSIDARLREVFQQSTQTRQNQVKLRELETSAATYKSIYETFLNRYTQVVQQQSFPTTEARVITVAGYGAKTSPKTALTLVLGAMAGLGLGLGLALAREHFDRVVRSVTQIEDVTGTPCFGVIPQMSIAGRRSDPDNCGPATGRAERGPVLLTLVDVAKPFSAAAELFRSIKVAIDLSALSDGTRVIGIVSAQQGEGKTTIASSLAATIASSGRPTLLIDGDLRNPSLSRSYGSEGRPGLLDVLSGASEFGAALQKHETGYEILLGSPQVVPTHSPEMLSSRAMASILDVARARFDYILVDLPPLLPVVDVRAAARLFDSFILVTEWGRTNVDEVSRALWTSTLVRERLLGTILNKVDVGAMKRFEGYVGSEYSRQFYGYREYRSAV